MLSFLKSYYPLIIIFAIALSLRFIYFPGNTYVSYDAARDALTSVEVLKGDFKIIGPYSSFNNYLHHGPLVYYLWAPLLFVFDKSPEALSAFTRIYNALGVFLIFYIGKILLNKKAGYISAILYALSYEQSQYALFLGHPTYAVLPVMLFYLGLALLLFNKKPWGLALATFSAGLAINFHYANSYLLLTLLILVILFRKKIFIYPPKHLLLALVALIVSMSTFIVAEIKYGFPIFHELIRPDGLTGGTKLHFDVALNLFYRFFQDNLINNSVGVYLAMLALLIPSVYLIYKTQYKEKILFLFLWLISGALVYLLTGSTAYYYSAGSSISLLLLTSLIISNLLNNKHLLTIIILVVIAASNLIYVTQNVDGPNKHVIIQPNMILRHQKSAIDYIYKEAKGSPFAINGITVPLYINTTWSYLFESHGMKTYGYLPVWGGRAASGYPGNLQIIDARTSLPSLSFLIIEPQIGIDELIFKDLIREENYFSKITEERTFGSITVQKRESVD